MKSLMSAILITLAALSGCSGHIQANYPARSYARELPQSWRHRGREMPVIGEAANYRIFFAWWDDFNVALSRATAASEAGSTIAVRDVRALRQLLDRGYTGLRIALFIKSGRLEVAPGSWAVTFEDGTEVQDAGSFYWEADRADARRYDSREKRLVLDRSLRRSGEPLFVMLLLPEKYMGMGVTSLALEGGEK